MLSKTAEARVSHNRAYVQLDGLGCRLAAVFEGRHTWPAPRYAGAAASAERSGSFLESQAHYARAWDSPETSGAQKPLQKVMV